MRPEELPGDIRVKLSKDKDDELWRTVSEFGGVKKLSDSFNYSSTKLYNWKNKQAFYPVDFVRKILGNNPEGIKAYKGGSNSLPVEDPVFPVPENNELLTRVNLSVRVNREGTPVYITGERELAERFQKLLEELGSVPIKLYRRDRFELRYPSYLHRIFQEMEYQTHIGARIDEEGEIRKGKIILPDREIPVENFSGTLRSEEKKLELVLERGSSERLKEILAEKGEEAVTLRALQHLENS